MFPEKFGTPRNHTNVTLENLTQLHPINTARPMSSCCMHKLFDTCIFCDSSHSWLHRLCKPVKGVLDDCMNWNKIRFTSSRLSKALKIVYLKSLHSVGNFDEFRVVISMRYERRGGPLAVDGSYPDEEECSNKTRDNKHQQQHDEAAHEAGHGHADVL